MKPRHVIVVGGGISGLATALALTAGARRDDLTVEVREADDRLGGKLRTSPFAGLPAVDEGADAFLARVPHATALAQEVGLSADLTSPTDASAAVWHDGLHPIPPGLLLGVPTDLLRLATTGLLSVRGKLRAAVEPLLPATDPDDSIGKLIRSRFGDEVQERLVDALVGSIYAADTDRFSLAAVPQLAALAERGRSLLLNARRLRASTGGAQPHNGPLFLAPRCGMGALVDAAGIVAAERGVRIHTRSPVTEVAADGSRWRVDGDPADAVVLATPAALTAPLVAGVAADAGRLMATMDHAGVVLLTMAVDGWPERLHGRSGYLVPKPDQRTVTAVSFGSQKWAHWGLPDGRQVLRVSLGRDGLAVDHLDDDELTARAIDEVGAHLALDLHPTDIRISRWPAAFPQYRPHHEQWVRRVDTALPDGLVATGASYGGIGIPACIAHAQRSAARVIGRSP